MKSKLLLTALLPIFSGCSSMGQLNGTSQPPSNDESIFVIGVHPPNHRISVFPGRIEGGKFHQSLVRSAAVYGSAKEGYVVGKASSGDVLAIVNVRVVSDERALAGSDFKPCGDAKTLVFEVPKGRVVYLGDVEYQFRGKQLAFRYSSELDAARRYVDTKFPALQGRIEQLPHQLLPTSASCTGATMYIPIYLPK